ncbi:hypothetical protein OH492_09325 [Vibrio chagasii]|nr:hypothetical protein [Vibrio chagasii]
MKGLLGGIDDFRAAYVNAGNRKVKNSTKEFVRYQYQDKISYGKLDKKRCYLSAVISSVSMQSQKLSIPLESVEVHVSSSLKRCCGGMNFASHLASPADAPPPMFLKLFFAPTGEVIQMPPRSAGRTSTLKRAGWS